MPKETERTTTPLDVANQTAQYVFETQNELSDPVSVIIKGANRGEAEKYYRVLLLDNTTGESVPWFGTIIILSRYEGPCRMAITPLQKL